MDYGEAHALADSLRCFKGHEEVCTCLRVSASRVVFCAPWRTCVASAITVHHSLRLRVFSLVRCSLRIALRRAQLRIPRMLYYFLLHCPSSLSPSKQWWLAARLSEHEAGTKTRQKSVTAAPCSSVGPERDRHLPHEVMVDD